MENLILFAVTGAALLWDLRTGKIPNEWIVTGLAAGFLCQMQIYGMEGVLRFFSGAGLPILFLALLFYFRMLGAGDIKLLAVIGGFLGPESVISCMAVSFLLGAAYSLFHLIRRGILKKRLLYFFAYIRSFYRTGTWMPYRAEENEEAEFCFSVPIFLSVLLFIGGIF